MSSDQIQPESDFYARWLAAPPAISGRAWVKRDLDFWHRCTIEECAGSRVSVLLDNMDELTVEREHVSQLELESGDVVFFQNWDGDIGGYAAVVVSVHGETAEIEFPKSLYRERERRQCLLRDLRLYCDLKPTEWEVGEPVFAYKYMQFKPPLFLLFPARVQAVHFGVCVEAEFLNHGTDIVPTSLVETLEVNEGDFVYTCTSYVGYVTGADAQWSPCRVLARNGESLRLQDGAGEEFETQISLIAVLPKGYRMIDGKFEKIAQSAAPGRTAAPAAAKFVHIVRTDHWRNADADPITKADVEELLAADPELAWSIADFGNASSDFGASPILWNGQPCLWWHRSEIRGADPSAAQLAKMIDIAIALDANVIGDDGVEYH